MDNDKEIVKAYASLWNNRSFASDDAEAVAEAIDLELLDKRTSETPETDAGKIFCRDPAHCEFTARTGCEISAGQITYRTRRAFKRRKRGAIMKAIIKKMCKHL